MEGSVEKANGNRDIEVAPGDPFRQSCPSLPAPASTVPSFLHHLCHRAPPAYVVVHSDRATRLRAGPAFMAPCFPPHHFLTLGSSPAPPVLPSSSPWIQKPRGVEAALEKSQLHSCRFCYPLDQRAPKFLMGHDVERGFCGHTLWEGGSSLIH